MSELRATDTNAGDDSAGRAFGLAGNLYLPAVFAALGGLALFAILAFLLRASLIAAALVGAVPLIVTLGWIVCLKHGKPAGYDRDFLENLVTHGHFTKPLPGQTLAHSHAKTPNGYFVDGMILYGSPEESGLVSKGFWLEPPDNRGASNDYKNACQDQLRAVLALATPGRRLQFQMYPDGDYRAPLTAFTAGAGENPAEGATTARDERARRYWTRMEAGQLRRERLALFVSIEISAYTGNLQSREGVRTRYAALLRELAGQFEELGTTLQTILGPDTPVRPMTDLDHFGCLRRFLNPSLTAHEPANLATLFDPEGSIHDNCWHCEGVGQAHGGFVLDGQHHAILALERWPRLSRPGIVTHLTGLPFLEYALSVNITPVTPRREISREEKAADRLRGEYTQTPRASVLVALRKKERKVEALSGGFTRPFFVTTLIRVWAPTREALREKVSLVHAAANAMDGAQVLECALPTTAKKLFFSTWPGWTHSSYHHRELYAEDPYLADLVPFSATFTGDLDTAEALYDGGYGNLVGICTHSHGSPQHAVVCGMSGSGKSAFLANLFLQTASRFHYTVIIDVGFSHQAVTQAMGGKTIVIHPDSPETLNYLDTGGLPLTQLHQATAVALLSRMIGVPDSAETLALRQAQLTQYLEQIYLDTFSDWSRRYPEQADEVHRLACGVQQWRPRLPEGATPLDAFVDLRDRLRVNDDEAQTFLSSLTDAQLTTFAQDPATRRFMAHTACAQYSHAEFPTHSALTELLAYARFPEHDRAEIQKLATLLRAWCHGGPHGKLFDGVSTLSLQGKHVGLELGLIPDQATDVKAAVGLLITGLVRQHIIALPRVQRKRILFEEVAQFLDIPGGEQIVGESYAQLRKHNCWAVSVVQQYSRFRSSKVRPAVIGNAKQYFLLRQSDRNDMADLALDIGLPETAVDAIQHYPMPEQQAANDRYSSICYFKPTAQPPQCGTLRHIQAPAL